MPWHIEVAFETTIGIKAHYPNAGDNPSPAIPISNWYKSFPLLLAIHLRKPGKASEKTRKQSLGGFLIVVYSPWELYLYRPLFHMKNTSRSLPVIKKGLRLT
jgi:hypothetical protein